MNTTIGNSVSKYEVIYYKRSNKVHKTKGVSRLDGILTITPPPSNLVTLCPAAEPVVAEEYDDSENDCSDQDDDEDDDDDEIFKSSRARMKRRNQRRSRGREKSNKKKKKHTSAATGNWKQPVYSGRNAEVVKRFLGGSQGGLDLEEDNDIVILSSSWECQIVREIITLGKENNTNENAAGIGDSVGGCSSSSSSSIVRRQQSLNSCSRSKTIGNVSLSSAQSNTNKTNAALNQNRLLTSKKSLVSGFRTPLLKKTECNTTATVAAPNMLRRNPPLQPKRRIDGQDQVQKMDECKDSTIAISRRSSSHSSINNIGNVGNIVKNTQSQPKFKPLSSSKTSATMVSNSRIGSTDCFQGAIGELNAPSSIKAVLRPHQQTGIVFLWNCLTGACPKLQKLLQDSKRSDLLSAGEYDCCMDTSGVYHDLRGGAILADEMGLGKTLMTITVIFALHRRNRNERFIVVCPSSLVENWTKEFDKFVGKASQPKRVVVRKGGEEGLKQIKSFVPPKPLHSEVLIISYDLFRMNSDILCKSTNIGLLVVDEGHRLKNTSGTKILSSLTSLQCNSRLLITGTPIQNNLSEFYNVANFVLPGVLGSLSSFRKVYEKPISAANKKNATIFEKKEGQSATKSLNDVTSIFMIRRLQKDILKSLLPPRFETLLFCRPSQKQCEMYKQLSKGPILDSLSTLTNLRKLCSHPILLLGDSKMKGTTPSSCSESGKLDVLEGLLDAIRSESPSDKVIVISNFTTALTVIHDYILLRKGWKSVRLDGTTEQSARQAIVDSFNRSSAESCFVFLLSSKAGGCGLNLTGANRLIMYDLDWNPSTDSQAMARIYRQGQKKECFIYRLLTTGTVEEVMFQRQTQKNNLDTIATNKSSKNKSHRFTDEELKDCFTLKEKCICDTKDKIGKDWEDYEGFQSLLKKCIDDEPLLSLARKKVDVISYVHLVQDLTSIPVESETESVVLEESCEEDNDWECFDEDSESEAEFE